MSFNISNFNIANTYLGCSVNSQDYLPLFSSEPKSTKCQLMHLQYASCELFGTLLVPIDFVVGATIQALGQFFKVARNMHCYDQNFAKALNVGTYEGLGALTAIAGSAALPKNLQRVSMAASVFFSLYEEAAQIKKQEDIKVMRLLNAADNGDQVGVNEQIGLMKIYRSTSQTDCNPLFIAADYSQPFIAKSLGKMDSTYTAPLDSLGNTPLHRTVFKNDIPTSKALLSLDKATLRLKNNAGETPLSIAVSKGLIKLAELLVDAGSDANFINRNGVSLAHTCYTLNSLNMFKVIAKGEDFNVNVQNKFGQTLIHLAARDKKADWVAELKDLGINLKIKDFNGHVFS